MTPPTVYHLRNNDGVETFTGTISPAPGGGSLPDWFMSGSGSPVGVVTPSQIGALYQDTTAGALFTALGADSSGWVQIGGNDTLDAAGVSTDGSSVWIIGATSGGEGAKVDSDGTLEAQLDFKVRGSVGFYGSAPDVQPTVPLTDPTVQDLITALANIGLVLQTDG